MDGARAKAADIDGGTGRTGKTPDIQRRKRPPTAAGDRGRRSVRHKISSQVGTLAEAAGTRKGIKVRPKQKITAGWARPTEGDRDPMNC